jgi:hypothetical protein
MLTSLSIYTRQQQRNWRDLLCRFFFAGMLLQLTGCLDRADSSAYQTDSALSGGSAAAPASGNSPPEISGSPLTSAQVGMRYQFLPSASDPDGDRLIFRIDGLPSWASFEPGSGRITGMPDASHIGTTANVRISVSDGVASASLRPFSVVVADGGSGAATVSWAPPLENEDGSVLTDLAGYRIYYGSEPGQFSNSVTVNNPGITTYVVDNLAPQTWYFAFTALNYEGTESDFSNRITRIVR